METYIVRQPILDRSKQVIAYEILYKEDESSLFQQRDSRVANAIEEFLTELSSESFLGGKAAFLTFTPNLLMKNIPKMFSPDRLVIQIEDNSIIHPVAQKMIYRYKKQGYKLAIRDFEFSPRYFSIMDAVDYVKVNFGRVGNGLLSKSSLKNVVDIAHSFGKQVVAYQVNSPAAGCEVGLDGVIGTSTLTQNGIFTTDAQGEIKITNLAPGAYVLNEIKAPTGYVMDSASTNVVIGQGGDTQTVVVTNSKAGTLVIDKRDSLTGKPLEGVTFKVTTSTGEFVPAENGQISSNGLYFTDKDGKITINGVVGTLVVTETATIPGYTIDEATRTQTVVVNPNDTQTLHFTNTPSTTLVIEKYIEGTTTPLKGVTFLVTDSSGAVVGNSNGEFITDENGRIVLNDLTPGTTITAREVKALEGYVLDGQPKSILIKAGEVQTLRFYNQKQFQTD